VQRYRLKDDTPKRRRAMVTPHIFADRDQSLYCAVQSGFKRIRSWRVPPNWSRHDWNEELAAVGTAAACQAVRDFDPARGVPLAGFGYCRVISQCLARYRKEWTYARHFSTDDGHETETASNNSTERGSLTSAKV